ncbi:hypothetical protein B0H14DRAFT_2630379 [Mycena olivaceomarginata]|nr:hypothetical protein B0H14DRAFT_2630379 [Mycena olivaceomarginata]
MAIVQSSRAPQLISVRPMRGVCPGQYDALDHWLALADLKTAPELFLRTPLPDDQTMCEMYMSIIELPDQASAHALDARPRASTECRRLPPPPTTPRLGITNDVHLGCFVGSSDDANAPLWVNRLPPQIFLRFSQPLAFVAKLVGGMTDIPVKSMTGDPADDRRMSYWSRNALAAYREGSCPQQGSSCPALLELLNLFPVIVILAVVPLGTGEDSKGLVDDLLMFPFWLSSFCCLSIFVIHLHSTYSLLSGCIVPASIYVRHNCASHCNNHLCSSMALYLKKPLSHVPISTDVQADHEALIHAHSNVEETLPDQTVDVSVDMQNLVAGATDAHATMIADVSADMKTPALVTEATDDEDVTMTIGEIHAAWKLEEETKRLLSPESGTPRRNFRRALCASRRDALGHKTDLVHDLIPPSVDFASRPRNVSTLRQRSSHPWQWHVYFVSSVDFASTKRFDFASAFEPSMATSSATASDSLDLARNRNENVPSAVQDHKA